MKSPAELSALFRARGLKVTPQREHIFRAVARSHVHPTAEAVYSEVRADLPSISLRTVYQTLNDLAAMGELVALDLGTGSSRFDPNLDPHHHVVCEACGQVRDVEADFADVRLPAAQAAGFQVSTTEIVFRGRCQDCAPTGHDPTRTAIPANPASPASPTTGKHTTGGQYHDA